MAECKGCFHYKVCDGDVGFGYAECPHYISSADVVPKSEVDKAKAEVAREIFAEIEEYFTKPKGVWFWQMDLAKIAELQKKYIPQDCPN